MTREEAISELEFILVGHPETSARGQAVLMAIEALKEPKARCLNCDFLKNCMHAWRIDCGCEFYQVDGVRPWEEEK